MSRTIDARIFYLLPNDRDKGRIETLTEQEICESFVLTNPEKVKAILLQQDKSILIIDSETYPGAGSLEKFAEEIVEECGDKIIRLFIIGSGQNLLENKKIIRIDRKTSDDDNSVKNIVSELNIWGMRSYIRFGNHNSRIAFFRMKFADIWRTGVIHDISASGMSCSFDRHGDIDVTEKSSSIELCIKDKIFRLSGSFLLRRTFKNSNMFVLVFAARRNQEYIQQLNSIIFKLTREQVLEKIERLAVP